LASESDPQPRGLDLGKPVLSEGNHLSYAMQWILFGLMAFGAVFWNISQDRRRMKGLEPRKLKSLNRDRDAEIEDEILK
jgi:cytochrome oxidase assembly protein ShyY1